MIFVNLSVRHIGKLIEVEDLLAVICQQLKIDREDFSKRLRDSSARYYGAYFLIKYSGLTQREVASVFNMNSGDAISKQLRRYEGRQRCDSQASKKQRKIDSILSKMRDKL